MDNPVRSVLMFSPMGKSEAKQVATLIVNVESEEMSCGMFCPNDNLDSFAQKKNWIELWEGQINKHCQRHDASIMVASLKDTKQIAGMIGWEKIDDHTLVLSWIYVLLQRQSIGSALIRRMLQLSDDAPEVHTLSTENALPFYNNIGFQPTEGHDRSYQTLSSYRSNLWQMCPSNMRPSFPEERYVPLALKS